MRIRKHLITVLMGLASACGAWAIPAKPDIHTVVQPDGSELRIRMAGDEKLHFIITEKGSLLTLDDDGYYRLGKLDEEGMVVSTGFLPLYEEEHGVRLAGIDTGLISGRREAAGKAAKNGIKRNAVAYPTTGSPKILVFLVEYSDVKFSTDYDVKEYFTRMMTEEGFNMFGGTGSATQYFREQSGGAFVPQFDVYGPVTLPENQAYYGGNYGQGWDMKAHYMVSHAAKILDPEIDFSQYDADKDGDVDFIYVFYAGQGEHNKGDANTVWPHAGNLKQVADFVILDKVWLNRYACSNEMEGDMPNGLGPFVHEYSHILGLPDLYAAPEIVVDRDFTPGQYSVLDYGLYNNDSRTPCNYSAFERNELNWNSPLILDGPMSVTLNNISTGDFGMIPTDKSNEYYLLENRQREGWDTYLPAHGMLVWHIDTGRQQGSTANSDRNHQGVDLVEANEMTGFTKYADGYTFPGITGKTAFTAETSPALVTWDGKPIDFPVTDIEESDEGLISFNIAGGAPEEDIPTGIDIIEPENLTPIYYNLQGIPVSNPEPGTIVIEIKGSQIRKILK